MKVFITGKSGFIGTALSEYLTNAYTYPIKHKPSFAYYIDGEEFSFIHCAAYGNHSNQKDVEQTISANITALQNLLSFLGKAERLLKFYNFSTSSVHLKHQTLYSATKLVGEKIIESLNDPRFVNVRPYSIFGKGEAPHRFIPTVIRCLNSGEPMQLDPTPVHDWTHIDDMIPAMFAGHTELGTGVSYSNMDVVKILESISGKTLNFTEVKGLRPYDTDKWVCPEPIPHKALAERLEQVYYELS